MLTPTDYTQSAIFNEKTRQLMDKIQFEYGGEEYDAGYPEGIPTSVELTTSSGKVYDSGIVKFPGGHALNDNISLQTILRHKFK